MKPGDFFIGVIEFFSVVLPGALLTFFLKGLVYGEGFGEGKLFPEPAGEVARWVVFLLVAYIVGNLVFMLAALLDVTYDKILRKRLFQPKYDLGYQLARHIREKFIQTDTRLGELFLSGRLAEADYREILGQPNREIVNTFKWAQHFLLFYKPEALAEIWRTEADSKFFRSLVVAFLLIAVLLAVQVKILSAVIFIALALWCYYRYGELRFKATQKAYEMIATFFYRKLEKAPAKTMADADAGLERQNIAALKLDMTGEFFARHRELLLSLSKGFSGQPKRLSIAQGEGATNRFLADQNASWYCLQGRGSLQTLGGNQAATTILLPNAIVPIAGGSEFFLLHDSNQPMEILVFENQG